MTPHLLKSRTGEFDLESISFLDLSGMGRYKKYIVEGGGGGGGVNRGMQIRRSVPCFRQIRQSANILDQIRKVNVNATVTGISHK